MPFQSKNSSVAVSVWNEFYSSHLVSGLQRAGFKVHHQTTSRQKVPCHVFERNITASALNRIGFKGFLPRRLAFGISKKLVDFRSAVLAKRANAFWGWSGCSLRGLRVAKTQKKPAFLERGSTHCRHQRDVVGREYARLGLGKSFEYSDRVISYDEAEYSLADRIFVPSRYVLNTFIAQGFRESQLILNPYGIDADFWSLTPKAEANIEGLTVLWVAGITLRKAAHLLIQAWKNVNLKNAELLMVGGVDPILRQYLRDIPLNIRLLGYKTPSEIRDLSARSDVYILPSFEEGMARSVLEAAAAGLPAIITEETGATDILKDGSDCWVVPSGNVDALVESLYYASKNRDIVKKMGENAALAVKPYTWEAYGNRAAQQLKIFLACN